MSQVYKSDDIIMCNNIAGLVSIHRELCLENPDVMVATGKGARLGVKECQRQMKDQRWNCSTVPRDNSVFGKIMKKGRLNCSKHTALHPIVINSCTRILRSFRNPFKYSISKMSTKSILPQKSNKKVSFTSVNENRLFTKSNT